MVCESEWIKRDLEGFKGTAHLLKLSKPIKVRQWNGTEITTQYFVVSGVVAFDTGHWEVLAFPADKNGKVLSWGEVAGESGEGVTHEDIRRELEEICKEAD